MTAATIAPDIARSQEELLQELKIIASVRIDGHRHLGAGAIERVMKTKNPSLWPWRERPVLRRDYLLSDVTAIADLYRHHGYLDATVEYRVASSGQRDEVDVLFLVHEGEPSKVRFVEFGGVASVAEKDLRRKLWARPGRAFDPAYLQLDTLVITSLYQERGFRPQVTGSAVREVPESLRVRVRYDVQEGVRYQVGKIDIEGRARVRESLVRRELAIRSGAPYQWSRVVRSQERLYESGLFSQVQIEPVPDSTRTLMNFEIRLRERKPRWVDAGIGSGTDERFRLTGEWGHRNLLGWGQQGAVGSLLTFYGDGKFQRWNLSATLLEPWLLRSRTRGQVTPLYERHDDRADPRWIVRQEFKDVNLQLRRELNRFTRLTLTQKNIFANQDLEILAGDLDPARPDTVIVPKYTTHSLGLGLERDIRDNPFNAARGSAVSVSAEVAGGPLSGSSSFWRSEMIASWYTPLPNGWTLATRARGGIIDPFGPRPKFSDTLVVDPEVARVPLEERFRTGGVNSIRGHDENSIHPSGGLVVLQASVEMRVPTELRLPFLGPLGIEAYVDAGNVWARPEHIRARELWVSADESDVNAVRYVAGLGPRANLPIGPLRLDFTWRLRPSSSPPRLQFAIGPSF
jgi:outer membrane protein assembly complex protein YaeT